MEYFPAPLEKLVEQFARLPGIGSKSAQRLAFHVLNLPMEQAQEFANAIVEAKQKVTLCPICRNLTAGGPCPICANPKRDESLLCVVADPRDVIAMERAREFHGRYHVLHGVLSPMNHVGPDDLQIKPLVDRVAQTRAKGFALCRRNDIVLDSIAVPLQLPNAVSPHAVGIVGEKLFESEGDIKQMATAMQSAVMRHRDRLYRASVAQSVQ